MIPKKIHYCWFGRGEKPASVQKCIESWKKFCPDYEIIEWNEDNFDIHCMPYTQQAYSAKKYAFVSDVARLIIVYKYGGIYLDTDVELIKSPDPLLSNTSFMGFETDLYVASGLGFGSEAGIEFFKEHIDQYKDKKFIFDDGSYNLKGCPKYATELLLEKGLVANGKEQTVAGVHIYPAEYFNPYDSITGKMNKTKNTYSVHWYDASWSDTSAAKLKIKRTIRRLLGKTLSEKIRKTLGN